MPKTIELIQYNELKKVSPTSLRTVERINLLSVFQLCQRICIDAGYGGLAVNEIPLPEFQARTGLDHHINAIFLRPNVNKPEKGTFTTEVLILNPKIVNTAYSFTSFEGCGSIASGKLLIPIARPAKFTITGGCYTPNNFSSKISRKSGYPIDDFCEHEADHINGKSDLSNGYFLRSIHPNSYDWKETVKTYQLTSKELRRSIVKISKPVVQFNIENKSFYLVDPNGLNPRPFRIDNL